MFYEYHQRAFKGTLVCRQTPLFVDQYTYSSIIGIYVLKETQQDDVAKQDYFNLYIMTEIINVNFTLQNCMHELYNSFIKIEIWDDAQQQSCTMIALPWSVF